MLYKSFYQKQNLIFKMFSTGDFINIHAHKTGTQKSDSTLYNHSFFDTLPSEDCYSVGLHPWHLADHKIETVLTTLMQNMSFPNVKAIGEIGIDRAIETKYELQEKFFKAQLTVSEHFKKPVIIHSVKAHSDILLIRKSGTYKMPWIIHGFNSSKQTADQLIKMNCYLSFGEALLDAGSKAHETFPLIPMKSIFLETDESTHSIEEIYEVAAALRKMTVEQLKQKISDNFQACFK